MGNSSILCRTTTDLGIPDHVEHASLQGVQHVLGGSAVLHLAASAAQPTSSSALPAPPTKSASAIPSAARCWTCPTSSEVHGRARVTESVLAQPLPVIIQEEMRKGTLESPRRIVEGRLVGSPHDAVPTTPQPPRPTFPERLLTLAGVPPVPEPMERCC